MNFGPARIEALNQWRDLLLDDRDARCPRSAPHRGFAPAKEPGLVGVNLNEERLPFLILAARIGERIRHPVGEAEGLDMSDFHRAGLFVEKYKSFGIE